MVSVYAYSIIITVLFHGTNCFSLTTSMGRSNNNKDVFSFQFHRISTTTTFVNKKNLSLQKIISERLMRSKLLAEGGNNKEEIEGNVAAADKKLTGRKKRLIIGYQLSSFVYLAASLFHLVKGGNNFLYYIFGGGTFTVAGILYILKGAAQSDRLGSDTYKRLNLSIILYAFVQQLLPAMGLGLSGRLFFKGPALLTLANGIKGYGYGCLGWDKTKGVNTILLDLKEGIISTLQGLTVVKAKSAGYVLGTFLLGSMSLIKVKELCTMLFIPSAQAPSTYYQIFSRLSRLARLGLMTTILYTLKDASDRDRLKGTTFIQLNFMAAVALLSMVFYLSPSLGKNSQTTILMMLASGCSAMTLFEGMTNFLKAKKDNYE